MAARTLDFRSSLILILSEIRYTLSRAQAHPQAAAYVPIFQALRQEWTQVQATELAHQEAIAVAQARVDAVRYDLGDFSDRFSKAVLTITKDDRDHAIYVHFFGKKTLSEFKGSLVEQLGAMQAWLPALQTSEHPALQAMAPELATLLTAAEQALSAKRAARQQNRQFRDVGERKQFIDKLNGTRKEVYGLLAKLPHTQPGLPSSFADQFFRRDASHGDEEAEERQTVASVTARITALTEELTAQQARLVELEADEAEAKKAEAELEADKAELAKLEKEADAVAAKAAALRAKLGER